MQAKPSQPSFQVLGSSPIRPGDADKASGQALFGVDVRLPGMLFGAVLRSPHAHARILSIDTTQALALEGVKAVITAADLPEPAASRGENRSLNLNTLARDKALYYGHAIAAVAATSEQIALEALELIRVDYAVLPPILDVEQAMREGAPILHADLQEDEKAPPTNLASQMQLQRGDVQAGFAQADVIVEKQFHTATVHQGYLEPQNATALFSPSGQLTIWTSTQGSFSARDQVAELLQISPVNVRVIPMEVGGGFGGKNRVYLEPLAALLSRKSGHQPVKLVMSHSEVLAATGPTSASSIWVKVGTDRAGHITAAQARLVYAAGAFPGSPVGTAAQVLFAPYRIENLLVDGYDVVVNKPWAASYRAPGCANAVFTCESVIDELSEKLGIDPIEFRLRNAVREGDLRPEGFPYDRIGLIETLEAARNHPHYTAPLAGPNQGRGVACGFWGNGGGRSSASASLNADGTVNLVTGSVDLTGTRLSLAMQLAEVLGIPVSEIKGSMGDTDSVGFADGSWGSRTTFSTGQAVIKVGQNLVAQLCERAADLWGVPPEQVAFSKGVFSAGERKLTFKELAGALGWDVPVVASAAVNPDTVGPSFATHIVDVEVDPETGQVRLLRYTAVQDTGKAVHPAYIRGQIQGAVTQGIGWALNEEYIYDEAGRLLNGSYLDYRVPTCPDVPNIEAVIVEVPSPSHPFGVRGVGEMSIVPPPGAIANAIHAALGVRMSALPMSPGRILEALWEKSSEKG
jgi:xanthine dehydrogenase molybdenum-binding subunit